MRGSTILRRLPLRAQHGHHQFVAMDAAEEGVPAGNAFRFSFYSASLT
jgi:hypothetical protein